MSTQHALRQKWLNQGVQFIDAETVYLCDDTIIGAGTIIEPFVIIGKGVQIAENCIIKGFSHLENCRIEPNVSVGPFARIRGESVLEKDVSIGNFVELKNAYLHNNVKAAHLSYLGDCSVGQNTNIGAGTITCNYDGFNKYQTTIGADCFIGSNTTFIAPIQVGDNVLTASGTIITQNVADNDLAISRASLKIIPNGTTRFKQRKKK